MLSIESFQNLQTFQIVLSEDDREIAELCGREMCEWCIHENQKAREKRAWKIGSPFFCNQITYVKKNQ